MMGQRFWARHNCWVGHSHFGTEATKVLQFWNGKNVHSGLLTNTKTWWWPGEYTTLFMLRRLFTQQVWPKDDRTAATWRTMELNAHIHRYCVYPDMARRGTAQHDTARPTFTHLNFTGSGLGVWSKWRQQALQWYLVPEGFVIPLL